MALTLRTLTPADLEHIQAFHRGEIQLPPWIVSWKAKIEDATRNLAAAVAQEALTPEEQSRYTHAIVQMMHRRDHLYNIWMQGLPFKTWDDLAKERPPSRDDLFTHTVLDTEDHLNGPGVPAFVLFLHTRWKGFLKDFTHALLRDCDPLLEEVLELTPEIRRAFSYPEEVFRTKNREVLETRVLEWVRTLIPNTAPNYVQRLLIANVMVAIGNEMGACNQMEFARCEAAEPDFPALMKSGDKRTHKLLEQAQWWQVDTLLTLWPSE